MSADFYFLHWLDEPWVPVAYANDDPEREGKMVEPGEVSDWTTQELVVAEDRLVDYLPNNVGPIVLTSFAISHRVHQIRLGACPVA